MFGKASLAKSVVSSSILKFEFYYINYITSIYQNRIAPKRSQKCVLLEYTASL